MSVLEMQLAAIKKITHLENGEMLKEILRYLAKTSSTSDEKQLNLTQHYGEVKEQYGNVLRTLAQ